MAFASWFSIYQHLPDAEVSVLCSRNFTGSQLSFNWPYRCGIRFFQHENLGNKHNCPALNKLYATCIALKEGFVQEPLLVIDPDVMAVRSLSKDVLEQLNDPNITFGVCDPLWYFKSGDNERFVKALNTFGEFWNENKDDKQAVMKMMESVMGPPDMISQLCCKSETSEMGVFTRYNKFGLFVKDEWIRSKTLQAPFAQVSEFVKNADLSADELQVVKLWQQMRYTYQMVK